MSRRKETGRVKPKSFDAGGGSLSEQGSHEKRTSGIITALGIVYVRVPRQEKALCGLHTRKGFSCFSIMGEDLSCFTQVAGFFARLRQPAEVEP